MNKCAALPVLAFALLGGVASGSPTTRLKVTVLENFPTTASYIWDVSGHSSVSCYGSSCSSNYTPSGSGTANVRGGILKLLLPDGRIAIAECIAKPDVGRNLGNAFVAASGGRQASALYRDCRMPQVNSTIDAEFNRSNVKVFMQAPSFDGSGRITSETYIFKRVFRANESAELSATGIRRCCASHRESAELSAPPKHQGR